MSSFFHVFSSTACVRHCLVVEDMGGRLCLMDLGLLAFHVSYSGEASVEIHSVHSRVHVPPVPPVAVLVCKEGTFKEGEFEGQEPNLS